MYSLAFGVVEFASLDRYVAHDTFAAAYFLITSLVRFGAAALLLLVCARRFDRWAAD